MSSVSETIVREYFELHEFLVRQHRKYIAQTKREEDDIDFFVLNPRPQKRESELPFVLTSVEVPFIERAIVAVKGWHTETFSSARIASTPEIFRFVGTKVFQEAARVFGENSSTLKILVIPTLPQGEQSRAESIALLRAKGIDAVIPFRTILADLISKIEVNRNYQKSDLLQMVRILKNYDFFKEPQLELFKPKRKRKTS
ncbi:MAG TPA: hypothetical protein VKV04_15635 [Verrucomicrobiae bacterium]|nr:hypothetical protein [Verrucomicrobiae bacterium]